MAPLSIVSWSDFLEHWAERWDDLLEDAGNRNPFLTVDWLQPWWNCFGSPGCEEIDLLTAEGGKLEAAVFLVHARERRYGLPVRTLRLWVNPHCAIGSLLQRCDAHDLATGLVERWLGSAGSWDLLRLEGLPRDGGSATALLDAWAARGGRGAVDREWSHTRVPVDRPWAAFYGALPRHHRRDQERLARRLAERGSFSWRKHSDAESVVAALEAYLELERRSWKQEAGEVILEHPPLARFYREMVRRFAGRKRCEIDLLLLDGVAVAGVVSLLYRGRMLTLKTSFDASYARYSPGWQLFRFLLEDAFGRGLSEIDIYGHGPPWERWSKDTRRYCDLVLYSPAPRGHLLGRARSLLHTLRGQP
jgi:CelD/BcsL family acetyltransferase involved in cellulose biosynthesis